jgi:TOTE conflict system primase-like protein
MSTTFLDKATVQLLVEIAGPEPVHIEMAARGPKKYYDVHRPLTQQDARAHLAGDRTCGATLWHAGGMTRALCYDADTPDAWLQLIAAAWRLSEQGYQPLLEESPAGRGGHLWIIFTGLVRTSWAYRHAAQLAPTLQSIDERWPSEGGQKVRLPGGLYLRPEVRAWCKLYDATGRLLSADGPGAARVLLDRQTPAEIVHAFPDAQFSQETGELAALPNAQDAQRNRGVLRDASDNPGPDQRWQQKYGRYLWFQFTPATLAAWYNERTQVEQILPPEKNGMGLASWRGERTASVGLRADGWVDFGASARRADGKQDGGDALELTVRVTQEAKPEVMRQIARQLLREAREAMESAAWRGEQPPAWVQPFMTDAGWQRYHALRAEAAHAATHTRGVAGFHPPSEQTQTNTIQTNQGPQQLQ